MKQEVDIAIVGAGFGGSLMAMISRRLGLSVALLERGSHPRMTIGESTTPLSNLFLERLAREYDLPRLAPLSKWGTWQATYPQLACGLKRGFSFFNPDGQELLVAASPHDAVADTHWFRSDADHFLVNEAQGLGVEYRDHSEIENVMVTDNGVRLLGKAGNEPFALNAAFLIDATGPRGFLHHALQLQEASNADRPQTESLYSHFTGVGRPDRNQSAPYPVDDAAVHYLFEGGWVWVLRFNNGVTSAGVAATAEVAADLRFHEGESAWRRLLVRIPALASQFREAVACQPFRHLSRLSYRTTAITGERWAMLPSAAGFIDPLLSTGFALTLLGIEKLAHVVQALRHPTKLNGQLKTYARETENDLLATERLISALYTNLNNFPAFTALTLLYFAAVSFAETAQRLHKPELASGFLLSNDPVFAPGLRRLLARAHHLQSPAETQTFTREVIDFIEPFNLGGFGQVDRANHYPVRADDLLTAGWKLGVSKDQIVTMLERIGFNQESSAPAS